MLINDEKLFTIILTEMNRQMTLSCILQVGQFDCAVFCPNIATLSTINAGRFHIYVHTVLSDLVGHVFLTGSALIVFR